MRYHRTTWVLAGILCLALWSASFSQGILWETYTDAAKEAHEQGNYTKAEKLWVAALKEAEKFGPQDPRLATGLNNLAALYDTQGKYGEAELLHKRSLAIKEKVLGPDHPNVAAGVSGYSRTVNGTCHCADQSFGKALPEVFGATIRDIKGFADSL